MKKSKKHCFLLLLIILFSSPNVIAQSNVTQLENERKAILKRIGNIRSILKQTAFKKNDSTGKLEALNKQIESNSLLIANIKKEIKAIGLEIKEKLSSINLLQQDLAQLKKEYSNMVYIGSKTTRGISDLLFIFSSSSFHELTKRLNSVKQYTQIRQQHFKEINKIMYLLNNQKSIAEQREATQKKLLQARTEEKKKLVKLKLQQSQLIINLTKQGEKLNSELKQRNQSIQKLDKVIQDSIAKDMEERALEAQRLEMEAKQAELEKAKNESIEKQPKSKKIKKNKSSKKETNKTINEEITTKFTKARGKLPWPVKIGFISGKFGISPHPVLSGIQVENLGINIQSQKDAQVCVIFEGVVKNVAFVPGMYSIIIIQHGDYYTVYAKLETVIPKVGQKLKSGDPIGTIHTDQDGITELQFQVWHLSERLDPIWWISQR